MLKPNRGGKRTGVADTVTEIITQSGDTADLSGYPLTYGENDASISDDKRQKLEEFEADHKKRKSEYVLLLDSNGNELATNHGGKGSVRIPYAASVKAEVFTHNHPRGKGDEGVLGGTFSDADVRYFNMHSNIKTMRASAEEGIYTITKGANYDKNFSSWARGEFKKAESTHVARQAQIYKDYTAKKITYSEAKQGTADSFNQYLVDCHNALLAGQKAHGYTYTLERWKP